MPEYLSPAVHFEELSSGVKPIQGVGTSTAGFVGHAVKGPIGVAIPINNFGEYLKRFGGFFSRFLPFAVKAFFDEGGRSCYVVRTCHYNGNVPAAVVATRTYTNGGAGPIKVLQVDATSPGAWGNEISIRIEQPDAALFTLKVFEAGVLVESFERLTMDPDVVTTDLKVPCHVEERINGQSDRITVKDLATASGIANVADRRPAPTAAGATDLLQSGADGLASLGDDDYIGTATLANGLNAFNKIDEVNILAIPDAIARTVHVRGMGYCDTRQDCFYIADCQQTIALADEVLDFKSADGQFGGGNAISSKYGALYAPWLEVLDPRNGGKISIPPSGAVAGRYAGTDTARGVHKAPAGVLDGRLSTVLGLQFNFVNADQEKLNPKGINLIRTFPGTGPVIWGARTVSSDPEWRYLNVRRLFIFLRQSILQATNWVVFEPNDPTLWKSIERNVAAFLFLQWSAGALVGDTPDQAFYVKCDAETNPLESIQLGRVITEIGVAPSKPAEFVIFRIQQHEGGASSTA
ncbi:MAG: phage tail sheath C-terminal domain-containing protein [Acidobacteriota bacterium]